MNWGDMRTACRLKLQDPDAKFWTDAELLDYANDKLEDLVLDSEAITRRQKLPLTSGTRLYDLPTDCYEIRSVRVNGQKTFGSTAFQLQDLDVSYLYSLGIPSWYYMEGVDNVAFYPIPSWTAVLLPFAAVLLPTAGEYGEVARWTVDSTDYTVTSEYGCVLEIIDTTGVTRFLMESEYGIICEVDTAGMVGELSYVYRSTELTNDASEPPIPDYMCDALIYGTVAMAFHREGQAKNTVMSDFYDERYKELAKDWFARNKEWARGQDQMISQQNVDWGSDLSWRMRVWP
jgi:hypothetical protein